MNITIEQIITTTTNGKPSVASSMVTGIVEGHNQSQLHVSVDSGQSISNSRATTVVNDVKVETIHRATCKSLRLDEAEVLVDFLGVKGEISRYKLTVLSNSATES